ncbi:MAG: M15 family metallopeptidase [Bacteroidota bacterium]
MRIQIWSVFLIVMIGNNCTAPQDDKKVEATQNTKLVKLQEETPTKRDSLSHILNLDYVMGKFNPAQHEDFVKIELKHADREGLYLRKEVYAKFIEMYEAASRDGVKLQIRSATRNFANQKRIWEAKWTGKRLVENGENLAKTTPNFGERALKILRFSSMPSTSRHHWGTDIDLNAFTNSYFEKGEGKKIYDWLQANASTYGFCQPYSEKSMNEGKDGKRAEGYDEEKWHWSYLPVALPLTNFAKDSLKNELISGFKGAKVATEIGVVEKYVLGINEECKKVLRH